MLHVGYWYHSSLLKGGDTMSNDILMLLFEGGLFLISLLTFIVLLIKEIKK
ncbi:putative holin-like toxin [Clostridium tyrobutyricum]|nr:putative holin-like toxin [Clostridium tyrobutyricum]